MTFGKRLRERRKEMRLTLKDVAKSCGLAYQFVQRIEKGDVSCPAKHLASFARELHIPHSILACWWMSDRVEELFSEVKEQKP